MMRLHLGRGGGGDHARVAQNSGIGVRRHQDWGNLRISQDALVSRKSLAAHTIANTRGARRRLRRALREGWRSR